MKKIISLLGLTFILSACSPNGYSDIENWMKTEEKSVNPVIKPIPEAKVFQPITFIAKDDPFKEKIITTLDSLEKNKLAPDMNRRKEPLEHFSLDQLKITGMITKDSKLFAIIKAPDGKNNYVTVGNYIGTNFGKIMKIDETTISLEERIKDADEWKIKNTSISFDQ